MKTRLAPSSALALALALALTGLLASGASAQEAVEPDAEPAEAAAQEPPPDSGIEEIVVLGAESEAVGDFEAGDSVVGFGAEDLAALGAQDIADLAAFTPNLEIVTSGATTPTFFIRGVGLNDFNANSTGAVAIYRDDVAINAPALQLGSLFDVEAVNVLRGPQGTGLARNASAGAIKIYSRKPTGEFGGFLRSELGNYDFRDFEGAVEAPIYEDLLAGRFAFRYSEREGTMKNRCGNAPAFEDRVPVPSPDDLRTMRKLNTDPPWSICNEPVTFPGVSEIPEGLPENVNDINNWAARGTILFQPTLDVSILANAHGSKRDELTRLGQSYGVGGGTAFTCLDGNVDDCYPPPANVLYPEGSRVLGVLGAQQTGGYWTPEVRARLAEIADCYEFPDDCRLRAPPGPNRAERTRQKRLQIERAKDIVANELERDLDSEPWEGDFNICSADRDADPDRPGVQCPGDAGKTRNDTWGTYLKTDVAFPHGMQFTSVSSYDSYDRLIDIDLDFSPDTLFHITTEDDGWQFAQDLRLTGTLGDEAPIRWDIGGYFLRERLDVSVTNDLGVVANLAVGNRDYVQKLWSAAGYFTLAFDFWDNFTLDGGFRYNFERKTIDYVLNSDRPNGGGCIEGIFPPSGCQEQVEEENWNAPTGTVRLTYRLRENMHVFWKYTRGWKPGTYNATSSPVTGVSSADEEELDAFETGFRGSWFEGRLGLDASFFYYDYSDYQLFTAQQFAGGQPEFVILNADTAEVYGLELDAVARPWLGAFLNVRFGWLESQFVDFVQTQQERVQLGNENLVVNRELQNTGNRLLNSPRFKVSLTGEQTIPLGRWGSLTARYDGTWTDTTFYDATEGRGIPNEQNLTFLPQKTIAQPEFWLHNVRLSWRLPGGAVELAGWVRNIADTPYKTFAFDGSTFNETSIYFVGDPRTAGGTIVVNF